MNIKQALQQEIESIQDEPLRSIFQSDLNRMLEFLEKDTDMDWQKFLCLVYYLAAEYCELYPVVE